MADRGGMALVAIEKVASVDYLNHVFDCYRDGRVAVPVEPDGPPPPGHDFADRVRPSADGGWFVRAQAPIIDDAPAQVSFSSGTTGEPKAILLSHRALADVTARLIEVMRIDAGISEYLAVPPTYSFGLGRARVVAAVGGRLYVPPRGFDPAELSRMLATGEVNALAAVPTILRVLIANPGLIDDGAARGLRWLEIGSQPMTADEKRAVRAMFPNARIVQHYGLTEASRTTFLDITDASNAMLESVGTTIGATEARIDDEGRICIRGPHVADGILTADGLRPLADGDGWLRTADLGRLEADGTLRFLGRADDLLNVGGIKVPAGAFEEGLAARCGGQADAFAVGGMPDALRGEIVMVAHTPAADAAALGEAARAVAAGFGLGAADVRLVRVDGIPRTDTGKVRRAALAGLAPAAAPTIDAGPPSGDPAMSPGERRIADIWAEALGVPNIARDDTFFDLGGDSLAAINVMIRMERAGIAPEVTQQIFEGRSVAEIAASVPGAAARPPASRRAQTSDAISMTRGLMVLVVIGGHWLPFLLTRMGSLSKPLLELAIPFFRLGTPGFAMMFGFGLTFYNLPLATRYPDRFRANMRRSAMVVGGGVAAIAAMRAIDFGLTGATAITPTSLFFGVLLAYLCLVLLSGVLLKALGRTGAPAMTSLILGLVALLASGLIREDWQWGQTNGVVELLRLMVVSKYGLPQMIGYVGLGMAMGAWFEQQQDDPRLPATALMAGVALALASAVLTVTLGLGHLWFAGSASSIMILAYCGVILLAAGGCLTAIRSGWYARGVGRLPLRILMLLGTMAFIAYVGHVIAMSLRGSLAAIGLPDWLAIGAPVVLFLAGMAYGIRRLHRLYFGA